MKEVSAFIFADQRKEKHTHRDMSALPADERLLWRGVQLFPVRGCDIRRFASFPDRHSLFLVIQQLVSIEAPDAETNTRSSVRLRVLCWTCL